MTTKRLTSAQTDRACGVVLGGAVGDALGAGYEFGVATPGPEGPRMIGGGLGGFAPGEWTDDTSMAWAILDVAASGADLRSEQALDAIALRFREWYDARPPDIGIQTSSVLSGAGPAPTAETMTLVATRLHQRAGRSGGNGSLMRTGPVALAHLDDAAAVGAAARSVSALTHHDPRAGEACALWCLGIRHVVLTGELPDLRALAAEVADDGFWVERVAEAETRPPASFTPNGYVVTALQAAWAAIAQTPMPPDDHPCRHLQDTLVTAIGIGDDTDTVAAIAGAMLGARWGMSAIPAEWRRILHGYPGRDGRDLERLAVLATRGGEPSAYGWPLVDHIGYAPLQYGTPAVAVHPFDEGVVIAGALALDELPKDTDAVVSLCLTGLTQVPADIEQITFRLMDEPDPAHNPNLDYVLVDAARTIAALRDEGKRVVLHCVAAHSRTPAVAIAYAMLRGASLEEALPAVLQALPAARPNAGFVAALERLSKGRRSG